MPRPQPSDVYSAFTWGRLTILGRILYDTRKHVANLAEFERGDTLCGVGFRAWEQTKRAIAKAAAYEHSDWLSITESGPHFTFKLRMMPIRFLRADAEQPLPPNYATADSGELKAAEQAFAESGQHSDGIFRAVCHADGRGQPLGVYLVHADVSGVTRMVWKIPLSQDADGAEPLIVPHTPVVLPDLTVESRQEAAERERRERAENERSANEKGEGGHNTKKGA